MVWVIVEAVTMLVLFTRVVTDLVLDEREVRVWEHPGLNVMPLGHPRVIPALTSNAASNWGTQN